MTLAARNIRVAPLQWEMGPRVVVESRGNPALRIVAIRASGLRGLRKLACMRIFVTILANLRSALELHFLRSHRHFMAITALDGPVRALQRKFRFRVVKTVDVRPRPHVMTGFAAQRRAVRAALRHAVLELAVMRIVVACRTGQVLEMEGQDFVGAACGADFVTIGTRHGCVSPGQRETCVAMFGDGKSGTVEVQDGVTALAFIQVRRGCKLIVVSIFVAIRTSRELHLVNRILTRGKMAFAAFDGDVLTLQRVIGSVVFLHAEE